jgi:hypothetical protein
LCNTFSQLGLKSWGVIQAGVAVLENPTLTPRQNSPRFLLDFFLGAGPIADAVDGTISKVAEHPVA